MVCCCVSQSTYPWIVTKLPIKKIKKECFVSGKCRVSRNGPRNQKYRYCTQSAMTTINASPCQRSLFLHVKRPDYTATCCLPCGNLKSEVWSLRRNTHWPSAVANERHSILNQSHDNHLNRHFRTHRERHTTCEIFQALCNYILRIRRRNSQISQSSPLSVNV